MIERDAVGKEAGRFGVVGRQHPARELSFGGERALELEECAAGVAPVERLVNSMTIGADLTVLDMWCAHRLAIPLAQRARRVTAVDFSKDACDALDQRCRKEGITNIAPWFVRLEEDLASLGMGTHDVVIASWPALVHSDRASTITLHRLARKRVYLCAGVGDGPFDRRMFEAAGRDFVTGPSYTSIYYNLIYRHLGILPGVEFLREEQSSTWESPEDALDAQRWMFPGMTGEEEERIRTYLEGCLVTVGNRWKLPYLRDCTWAILWWKKD